MFELPSARYASGRRETTQEEFGGYDHRVGAGDGTIWDCYNMSGDAFPKLTTRKRRYTYAYVNKPNGMYIRDCVCWVDGTDLYVDGEIVGQVIDGQKRIVGIQDKIIVLPDKLCYDRGEKLLSRLESSWTGEAGFGNGTYAGEAATANTITATDVKWTDWFKVGDAVEILQDTALENGLFPIGPLIVREIKDNELRFYENSFSSLMQGAGVGLKLTVTIRRTVPDMDFMFEHANRLWGCKGDEIYASALGDPTNWNIFDNLSTDSWQLTVGSEGDFTGCCSYGGRPMFFKEHSILKIYGDTPQEFATYETEVLGVEHGSHDSLAVAGGTLFYKSVAGIMAYGGSYPRSAAEAFGDVAYRNAVAGSDGVKYYVSMEDKDGEWRLFVYDTRHGVWHPESGQRMVAFGLGDYLYAQEARGAIWIMEDVHCQLTSGAEEGLRSMVEFADFTDGTTRRKGPGKLRLRMQIDQGVKIAVKIQYDSDGSWRTVRTEEGDGKKGTVTVPILIRRCDHYRIRLEGDGLGGTAWTLRAITRDRYVGSDVR